MAGPFCTHTLRSLGAAVIKVEAPGKGDVMRHYDPRDEFQAMAPPFIAVNAGKHSIAINLKHSEGIAVARKLVSSADVVVENFRPGVMQRLGLGYEACKSLNEKLIYCSVTGFGQTGPLRDNPAYDHIVQAFSGIMSLTGEPGSKATKVGFPVVDTFAGYTAATAIIAALLQRERFGEGQYIDVAMLDASLNLMISMVAPYLIAGDVPKKVGNRGFNNSPTSDTFASSDGEVSIGANTQVQFEALCKAIGREDMISDSRYLTHNDRLQNKEALCEDISAITRQKTAVEWESIFNAVGVPSAAIRNIPDVTALEHLQTRDLFRVEAGSSNERKLTLGPGFNLQDVNHTSVGPAPGLGEHSDEILQELGYPADKIATLRQDGAIQ
jgi:CoA:oxalate CoA-transferase